MKALSENSEGGAPTSLYGLSRQLCINMADPQPSSHLHKHVIIYNMISFGLVEAGRRGKPPVNRQWSHGWCLALAHDCVYFDGGNVKPWTVLYILLRRLNDKWQVSTFFTRLKIYSLYSCWFNMVLNLFYNIFKKSLMLCAATIKKKR